MVLANRVATLEYGYGAETGRWRPVWFGLRLIFFAALELGSSKFGLARHVCQACEQIRATDDVIWVM